MNNIEVFRDTQSLIRNNDRLQKLTQDAVGKMTQYDLIPEEERAYYKEQVRGQFVSGNIAYLQHPIKRKDGTVIQVICNGERYFDSSVRAFRSVILMFEVSQSPSA